MNLPVETDAVSVTFDASDTFETEVKLVSPILVVVVGTVGDSVTFTVNSCIGASVEACVVPTVVGCSVNTGVVTFVVSTGEVSATVVGGSVVVVFGVSCAVVVDCVVVVVWVVVVGRSVDDVVSGLGWTVDIRIHPSGGVIGDHTSAKIIMLR